MIVVLDSNVWLSELGLRSGRAAATKFFLKQRGATLALPEVVRLEVQENLQSRLTEHIEKIRDNHRQLLTAFGRLKEVVLPSEDDVKAKVQELFDSIAVDKLDIPFSFESARSSFLKTIQKVPPSDKTQEFKDGVLWADCVRLLASDAVTLVTADKAFYQDREYKNGLAQSLRTELSGQRNEFTILPSLSDLLKAVRKSLSLSEDDLAAAFLALHGKSVYGLLIRLGFELGERKSFACTPYATEDPSVVFIEFSMDYGCADIRGDGRTDAVLTLKGDSAYVPAMAEFRDLRNFGETLAYRMADGTEKVNRNQVAFMAGIVLGHREVSSETRYRLDD
jgi:hypothetical protein